jgi:hypothetical protein
MLERFALVKFMVASITIGRDGKTLAFGAMIRATKLAAGGIVRVNRRQVKAPPLPETIGPRQ